MRKRQIKFILALSALSVLIWLLGELLIAEVFNNYYISLGWAIFCLVGCCAYSVWKCPHEPYDEQDDDKEDE
jgi:hypothetical protein